MLKLVPNTPVAQVAQRRRAVVCVSPVRRPGQGASSLSETGGRGREACLAGDTSSRRSSRSRAVPAPRPGSGRLWVKGHPLRQDTASSSAELCPHRPGDHVGPGVCGPWGVLGSGPSAVVALREEACSSGADSSRPGGGEPWPSLRPATARLCRWWAGCLWGRETCFSWRAGREPLLQPTAEWTGPPASSAHFPCLRAV